MTDEVAVAPADAEPSTGRRVLPLRAKIAIPAAAVVIVAGGAAGLAVAVAGPSTGSAQGSMTLGVTAIAGTGSGTDGNFVKGDRCSAQDGYTDIASGAEVDVVDASGKVLGTGTLGDGTATDAESCVFRFTVANLPKGNSLYGVKVGNSNRGVVHFSNAEFWKLGPELSLG